MRTDRNRGCKQSRCSVAAGFPAGLVKGLGLSVCLVGLWLLAIGFSCASAATNDVGQVVLAGCEPDYPPFCLVDEAGQAAGFSVELLDAVLAVMGMRAEYRVDTWSTLKTDLAEGRLQVLPLVGRTPEREPFYDFTFPYLTMHGTIVVRDDETGIHTPEDLRGRQVAVLRGDNAEEYLLRSDLGAAIVPLDSFEEALRRLADGRHDAVVIQRLLALQLIRQNGWKNLKVVDPPIRAFRQTFSLAVRKGDHALLARLNEGLAIAMADDTFRALSSKWFGDIQSGPFAERRIVVGGDANLPPYHFIDENGRPSGYTVALTRAIAKHLELEVEFRLGDWASNREAFERGEIDIMPSMFFSEERSKLYAFSPAHAVVQYVVATRRGTPERTRLPELAGDRIAVMPRDIMHDAVLELGYETNLVMVASQEAGLERLAAGEVDSALVAKASAYYWIQKNNWNNIHIPDHAVLSAEACYAVLPENAALGDLFADALSILRETGEYRRVRARWLAPYEPSGVSMRRVLLTVSAVVLPLVVLLFIVLVWLRSLRRQVALRTRELAHEVEGHKRAETRATEALTQTRDLLREADRARSALLSVVEDQKETEEKLRDSEERFRSLYHSMSEGVAIHGMVYEDAQAVDFVIESVNPAFERLLAREAYEIVGRKGGEVYGDDLSLDLATCTNVAETAQPARFELQSKTSGRCFFVSLSSPSQGHFAALFEDITERKQAEREHKRLMAAIEQTDEVIVITDPEGAMVYVNPAFEKTRGYAFEEIVGQNVESMRSGEHDHAFYTALWASLRRGNIWKGRFTNRRKDGTLYIEDTTLSPVFDEAGTIINFVSASRDVTEAIRMTEHLQQSQRMESIGRLAGGVAHDFNNMLGVIMGNAELAMDRVHADDPIVGELSEIRKAAERSAALTRQLLAFARQEAVVPQIMDLNDAVGATLKMLRRLIGEDIELIWRPTAGDATVKLDPSQVDQILTNLAVNASDAVEGVGRIAIETRNVDLDVDFCSLHTEAIPGAHVLLMFSDTGCGMEPDVLEKIFEPFFTTKGVGKGTGLGLATVYGIVRQNGGFVSVYSEPGNGTIFNIYLQQAGRDAGGAAQPEAAKPVQPAQGTILVVEDEAAILQITLAMLHKLGYTVFAACSAAEAEAMAAGHAGEIDLLLTDMIMPEMNGLELARKLRADDPALRCIFMSGYSADLIKDEDLTREDVGFIRKPFTISELSEVVGGALNRISGGVNLP